METETLIDAIAVEGYRLADAADNAGLDAKVPSCPRWRVRDLVRHTGGVHRWAGGHLRAPQKDLIDSGPLESQFGGWPDDAGLIDWYRGEVDLLVRSLREAPDDMQTATFLPAPTGTGRGRPAGPVLARGTGRHADGNVPAGSDSEALLGPPPMP